MTQEEFDRLPILDEYPQEMPEGYKYRLSNYKTNDVYFEKSLFFIDKDGFRIPVRANIFNFESQS